MKSLTLGGAALSLMWLASSCKSSFRTIRSALFLDNNTLFVSGSFTNGGISETGWMALWNFRRSQSPIWVHEFPHAPFSPLLIEGKLAANLNREIHFFDLATGKQTDKRGKNDEAFTVTDKVIAYSRFQTSELCLIDRKTNSEKIVKAKNAGNIEIISEYAPDTLLLAMSATSRERAYRASLSVLHPSSGIQKDLLTGFYGRPKIAISKTRQIALVFMNQLYLFDANLKQIYQRKFREGDTLNFIAFEGKVLNINILRNTDFISYTLDTETREVKLASPRFYFTYPRSPDNSLVFSASDGSDVGRVCDSKTGKVIAALKLK